MTDHYPFHYSRDLPKRNDLRMDDRHPLTLESIAADHARRLPPGHPLVTMYSRAAREAIGQRKRSQMEARGYDPYNHVGRWVVPMIRVSDIVNVQPGPLMPVNADGATLDELFRWPPRVV